MSASLRTYYPAFLDLKGKKCLIVGGGKVAERKVRSLVKAGANVTLISPELTASLKRMSSNEKIGHKKRRFRKGDTGGFFLVIAATSDEKVNRRVFEESKGLINSVDMPDLCNFIVPSVVSKGPLQIAISTSGLSPAVSRTLRKDLEEYVHKDVSRYLSWLKNIRERIKKKMPGMSSEASDKRTRLLKKLGSKEMLNEIRSKGFEKARKYAERIIEKDWES
ncbi:MAG: bifunctional precorrin-2 dehydrogenase/sirohydrochlorin ferrochelatase [Nitrospirota bacterium]|nr:MAG: bifunctional precorrin-2 dehydrogenase/sirohydrochlorin ferrochelatase [Nitrospirota bacterium]